jgi:uncharacterized repeat protein (TIGR01451 family)
MKPISQPRLRTLSLSILLPVIAIALWVSVSRAAPQLRGPVWDGPELDYQPAILRIQPSGRLMIVFERLNPVDQYGTFFVTFSDDAGQTWSTPQQILASVSQKIRHPALVQFGEGAFALFYLKDITGSADYRLFRATSTDGVAWSEQNQLDLGWTTEKLINPSVICEEDGTLTMVYHRLSGPSYLARSTDQGASWDSLKTQVSNANAQLPRLAKRESDSLYLVTYQVGGGDMDIYAKVSADPYNWDVTQAPFSTEFNSHDSQPEVLEDGTFLVAYAQAGEMYFDVYYRTSPDGVQWSDPNQVTSDPLHYDTQPHPLLHGIPGHLILTWSHQKSNDPYVDHDVWIDTDLLLPLQIGQPTMQVAPDLLRPGDSLVYTLTVPNIGEVPFTFSLSDTLPLDATYLPASLEASLGVFSYITGTHSITWTGMISASSQAWLTFQVLTEAILEDGTWITNTARLVDGMGVGQWIQAGARVDGLPPASMVIIPTPGQVLTSTILLVHGNAIDNVSGLRRVMVSLDGEAWQQASGLEAWSFAMADLAQGTHNLRSRAEDSVGWVEDPSSGITFTVDTLPPWLVAFEPLSGSLQVPLTASLVLSFSESMLTDTLVFQVTPDPGGWEVRWDAAGTVVTLYHASFTAGQAYEFQLISATDRAGHPALPVTVWFSTYGWYQVFGPLLFYTYPGR